MNTSAWNRLWLSASSPLNPAPAQALGLFRIWFGLLMLWEVIYFLRIDFVNIFLSGPQLHLHYTWLGWIPVLPETVLTGIVLALLASTILIILGLWYRWAMLFFFVGFSYLFVIDQAYYNNHLYLICLLAGWMSILPMDAAFAWKKPIRQAPALSYGVLRFHIVLVYFFGGIAKINPDWLYRQEPVRELISQVPFFTNILGENGAVHFLTYGGLIFDLVIGIFLLYRPLRLFGIAGAIFFNGSNAILFSDINIFPFFMLGSIILFLEPEQVEGWFKSGKKSEKKLKGLPASAPLRGDWKWVRPLLIGYVVFHCIWPFRHLLIPGPVDWTGQGQRFAWRMKIQTRSTKAMEFYVMDYRSKQLIPVDLDAYLINFDQRSAIAMYPQALMQMVDFLEERGKEKLGHSEVGVRAKVEVSFNRRPPQDVVDPEADLSKETYTPWGRNDWIMPLKE